MKVTWLVGENRGERADVFHELGAITRQSLTSDASFLKRAGSETLVLDAIAVLSERESRFGTVCSETQQTYSSCFLWRTSSLHEQVIVPSTPLEPPAASSRRVTQNSCSVCAIAPSLGAESGVPRWGSQLGGTSRVRKANTARTARCTGCPWGKSYCC